MQILVIETNMFFLEKAKKILFTPLESPAACPVRSLASIGACSGDEPRKTSGLIRGEARPASRSEAGDKIPFGANTGFKAPCEPSRWKVKDLLTGFTLILLISLFFFRTGVGLSQPASQPEKGPEIGIGNVTVKIRELKLTPPLNILELQIEILNQSAQSVAPPDSIKVVVTPKDIRFSQTKPTSEFPFAPQETTLPLPLPPKTGRVTIMGYPLDKESPKSAIFEVQINPPKGEKKVVTWEGH